MAARCMRICSRYPQLRGSKPRGSVGHLLHSATIRIVFSFQDRTDCLGVLLGLTGQTATLDGAAGTARLTDFGTSFVSEVNFRTAWTRHSTRCTRQVICVCMIRGMLGWCATEWKERNDGQNPDFGVLTMVDTCRVVNYSAHDDRTHQEQHV